MRITPRQGLKTKQGKDSTALALFVHSCVPRQPIRINYRSSEVKIMPGGGLEPPTRGFSALLWQMRGNMTTFNRATDLPPAINTLEELKVWVDSLLQRLYGSKEYEETQGAYLQPVIDYSIVRTSDGKVRQITRSSIPIDADYLIATQQKFWTFAESLGDVDVPAAFKVD